MWVGSGGGEIEDKEIFYKKLQMTLNKVKKNNYCIIRE